MYLYRQAHSADVPEIYRIVQEFSSQHPFGIFSKLDSEKAESYIASVISNTMVVEADDKRLVGILGGYITPYQLSHELVYQSLFWWADKTITEPVSTKLLELLEQHCRNHKIRYIVMGHLYDDDSGHLDKFYELKGYRKVEVHYIHDLQNRRES